MITISEAHNSSVEKFRIEYLNSLPYFQEYFLETLVWDATPYLIEKDGEAIGYCYVQGSGLLVEFHLKSELTPISDRVFEQVIKDLSIQNAYCKTFDSLLLSCCLTKGFHYKVDGLLFRNTIPAPDYSLGEISVRYATPADIPMLLEQPDGLYGEEQEMVESVEQNTVLLYSDSNQLVGCGYLTRIHPKYNYFDLGMWVHPSRRCKGHAAQIISHLKNECVTHRYAAVLGCAFNNYASKKVLERNGFITKHKLVKFKIKPLAY